MSEHNETENNIVLYEDKNGNNKYLDRRTYIASLRLRPEAFITAVKRENFDYTRWHEEEFANGMSVEDVVQEAVAFAQKQ